MKKIILLFFSFFLLNSVVCAATFNVPSTCSQGTKTLVNGKYYCVTDGTQRTLSASCGFGPVTKNVDEYEITYTCCESGQIYLEEIGQCAAPTNQYILMDSECEAGDELLKVEPITRPDNQVTLMYYCCHNKVYNGECYQYTGNIPTQRFSVPLNKRIELKELNCNEGECATNPPYTYYLVSLDYCYGTSVAVDGVCKNLSNPTCDSGTLTTNQNECAIEDNVTPTVTMTAKKNSSGTAVSSDTWSDEGLKFTFTKGTVGVSGATITYCKDTANTCNPTTEVTSGTTITSYTGTTGTYYIRYKIVSGAGLTQGVLSYKAKVDTVTPTISFTAKKANSNTAVTSGTWSDDGLRFILAPGTVGDSGATITYCKDTNNTCSPTTSVQGGGTITNYTSENGNYYIRYKITSDAGKSSTVGSFNAKVDTVTPSVTMVAKKVTSNTEVASDTFSDEGLKFILTKGTVGDSGATIKYCQDTANNCTPDTDVTSGTTITAYTSLQGIYYIRYKITSGSGKSYANYYKAKVDNIIPEVQMVAKKSNSGTTVTSGTVVDEGLKYTFSHGNVGVSSAQIKYCQDTTNTCEPNTNVNNGATVTALSSLNGSYYVRYNITNGLGKSSSTYSFNAKVETGTPSVTITANKATSGTAILSGVYSNEGLKFTFKGSNIGVSGATIKYCKDTANTCTPSVTAQNEVPVTGYVNEVGTYYIRYSISNGLGKSSSVGSYEAKVDTSVPSVTINVKKYTSGTTVATNTYSDEGLKFLFTQSNVGSSGATIKYCKDTTNTCTPSSTATNNTEITSYYGTTGLYYIRYKIISGVFNESEVKSFTAKVDTNTPKVTIQAKKATSNTVVSSGTYSDEELKYIFTLSNTGISGGTIKYCKDTTNTCTPNKVAVSESEITDFTNVTGDYYIRYNAISGAGKASTVSSYTAKVDKSIPSVSIVAKKVTSNTEVASDTYSDEGLVFTLTSNSTGASIKYCKDSNDTCTPSYSATSGTAINTYSSTTGEYYFRYKVTSAAGKESAISSYKAKVDTGTPTVSLVAKKATSNTNVNSGVNSNEGLKYTFTSSNVGISGGTIKYCKDTTNTCTPSIEVSSGVEVSNYSNTNGTYYIRYNITSGAGKASAVLSYNAIVDNGTPSVSIEARKVNSNSIVASENYSDEGLKFVLTQDNVGSSGATIYYCKDTTNSCSPNSTIASGTAITSYTSTTGIYYIRYRIKSGSGTFSDTYSYKAIVDTNTPTVSIVAKKATSNAEVASGEYSDEQLKFILTKGNVGVSNATIYYCKDTDNTCNPTISVVSGTEITTYTNLTGTYYIRYKVTSGAGKGSDVQSYKAMVDTDIPTVSIEAKKVNSGTIVENNSYSDEGLTFKFTEGDVGESGATIYYCKDSTNTCTPSIVAENNVVIDGYSSEKGIYYIRYKIVDGTGKSSATSIFKATIDDEVPTVSVIATKIKSGDIVGTGATSDEGLNFSFTTSNSDVVSGMSIYYCKDNTNTCTPSTKVTPGAIIISYANLEGTYYIRYKAISGSGKSSDTYYYEAVVNTKGTIDPSQQDDPGENDNNYKFIYGENQVVNFKKSKELIFKVDADKEKLIDVYLNKQLVDKSNYIVTTGSTIITFKEDFIKSLDNGKYTLTAVYNDGEATTTFVVNNSNIDNPHTGAFITVSILVIGLVIGIVLVRNKKKFYRI